MKMKKNSYQNRKTWFYWEVKNGKRSGKLLKTNNIRNASKCIVIPPDKELVPLLLEECLYFCVEYNCEDFTVTISYFYPVYASLKDEHNSYVTELNKVEVEKTSMVCDIRSFTHSQIIATNENTKSSFGFNLPEPVMKYAVHEIQNMQEVYFGLKPESYAMKSFAHKSIRLGQNISLTLQYRKKCFNEELVRAYIEYPSAPYIYFYLKHCSLFHYPRLELLANCEYITTEEAKDFFDCYGIKYSKRFIRKTSMQWETIEKLMFILGCNFSNKRLIYKLLKNSHLYHVFFSNAGCIFLEAYVNKKGDKKTYKCLKAINKMQMSIPEDMWEATMTEILK